MVLGTDNPYAEPQASFKFPVQPPDVEPDDGDSAVVCFSRAWLPYVMGALQQLTLQATWKDDVVDMQLTLDRAQQLLAMVGSDMPACPDILVVKGLRYNPDDNLIEQTFDEGATWQPAEGFDPRHNPIFLYPAPGGDDPTCQGAANLTRFIENLIETTLNNIAIAGDATGLALTLLPLVLTLGPYALLFDLVLALAVGLVAAGATAISAAFVPETYDTLTCIFYCNMDAAGRVNVGAKEDIQEDINDELGGLIALVCSAMFLLMGEVGMSNAAATGDAPADCDECACEWCCEVDLTGTIPAWLDITGDFWQHTANGITSVQDGSHQRLSVDFAFPQALLTSAELEGESLEVAGTSQWQICLGATVLRTEGLPTAQGVWGDTQEAIFVDVDNVQINQDTAFNSTPEAHQLKVFRLRGTGDIPCEISNC
jgi:hypothetical protein